MLRIFLTLIALVFFLPAFAEASEYASISAPQTLTSFIPTYQNHGYFGPGFVRPDNPYHTPGLVLLDSESTMFGTMYEEWTDCSSMMGCVQTNKGHVARTLRQSGNQWGVTSIVLRSFGTLHTNVQHSQTPAVAVPRGDTLVLYYHRRVISGFMTFYASCFGVAESTNGGASWVDRGVVIGDCTSNIFESTWKGGVIVNVIPVGAEHWVFYRKTDGIFDTQNTTYRQRLNATTFAKIGGETTLSFPSVANVSRPFAIVNLGGSYVAAATAGEYEGNLVLFRSSNGTTFSTVVQNGPFLSHQFRSPVVRTLSPNSFRIYGAETDYSTRRYTVRYVDITTNPILNSSCSVSPTTASTGQNVTWSASASGGTGSYTYSWSGTDGLSGSTQQVARSYNSTGVKTGSVTVTSGTQSVTVPCSNNVTITQQPVTASCSVSPTSIFTGQSATWSASASGGSGSYTYSWSGTDGLAGSTNKVSKIYTSAGTKNGSVTVSSGGQSITAQCSNSVSVTGRPDLIADGINRDTITAGISTVLRTVIWNIGDAPTGPSGSTFTNTLYIDNNANHATVYDTRSASMSRITAGNTRNFNVSYTFPTPGMWYVRACADTGNNVSESNENNNCTTWQSFTVYPHPTPTATLTATPASIDNGQSSLLSWSSTNATSCTGVGFNTGGATSGSRTVSPTSTTTYSVTCSGSGGSAQDSAQVAVTNRPDLIIDPNQVVAPSTVTVEVSDAAQGAPVALQATVRNVGTASTNSSFTNSFFINTSPSITGQSAQPRTMSALNAGASRLFEASHTFPSSGTYYVRACADQNASGQGTIVESNENNNCTPWRSITISITIRPPDAVMSLSAQPTLIAPNTSSTLTWNAQNVEESTCSLTGPNLNVSGQASGSESTGALSTQATYTLRCRDLHNVWRTVSATVSMIPEFMEF